MEPRNFEKIQSTYQYRALHDLRERAAAKQVDSEIELPLMLTSVMEDVYFSKKFRRNSCQVMCVTRDGCDFSR